VFLVTDNAHGLYGSAGRIKQMKSGNPRRNPLTKRGIVKYERDCVVFTWFVTRAKIVAKLKLRVIKAKN
jgi:hypothetical protein